MKILKETKTYLALISALFLVGCYSNLRNLIDDIEEQLVEEDEIAVDEEIQEAACHLKNNLGNEKKDCSALARQHHLFCNAAS